MAIQLQIRRGNTAQNDAFTGAAGELSVNTDNSAIRVHDGVVAGGVELARSSQIDSLLSKDVSGAIDVTLSSIEAGNSNHEYTGTLTGNINVIVPALSHNFTAENLTSGAFTLTVKTPLGTGIIIPQGKSLQLYCNGTNVEDSNSAKADLSGAVFTGDVATTNLAGKNVIVNSGCEISQVNGSSPVTPTTGSYPIDNMQIELSAASKLQTQQVTTALNSLGAVNAITFEVLATYSPAATDVMDVVIPIEGVNFARFQYGTANAKTGSLQFKARASVAGTYSGVIANYAINRCYPFTYTLEANTDTLVKIENIPGDTGGTWVGATNAGAAYICFDLGGGVDKKTTAGSWAAGSYRGATGATNLTEQIVGSTLSVTDIQFEVSTICTAYERKPYYQVLQECYAYYETGGEHFWSGYATAGQVYYTTVSYKVAKRTAPTVSLTTAANNAVFPATASLVNTSNSKSLSLYRVAIGTGPGYYADYYAASARL